MCIKFKANFKKIIGSPLSRGPVGRVVGNAIAHLVAKKDANVES
jgi:hypothetical protein